MLMILQEKLKKWVLLLFNWFLVWAWCAVYFDQQMHAYHANMCKSMCLRVEIHKIGVIWTWIWFEKRTCTMYNVQCTAIYNKILHYIHIKSKHLLYFMWAWLTWNFSARTKENYFERGKLGVGGGGGRWPNLQISNKFFLLFTNQ